MEQKKNHTMLTTENLNIGYRHKHIETVVASSMDFSISEGELVGIIGVNGAGKSTLLKTLTKELLPLQGSVFVRGMRLQNYSNKKLSELVSVVLTNQIISKNLSVYELVALGRQPYTNWLGSLNENDQDAIARALARVEIQGLANKKCNELSDGQLQKVLIARALAQDTSLIFMDEPTTHLDIYHKISVLQLLKKLTQDTQKAIIFATHEINLALQLCDKIILLGATEVFFGTPEELILRGVFDSLFPSEIIEFHQETKSFHVRKQD